MSWYLAKIKSQQETESGVLATVSETFLLDSVSYTDAEAMLYGHVASNHPDFTIDSLNRIELSDVFEEEDGDIFFKAKMFYTSIDDTKGPAKEKKINSVMLINASDPKQALERIADKLKNMLVPYTITDINTTQILDIVRPDKEDKAPEGFRPLSEVLAEQN